MFLKLKAKQFKKNCFAYPKSNKNIVLYLHLKKSLSEGYKISYHNFCFLYSIKITFFQNHKNCVSIYRKKEKIHFIITEIKMNIGFKKKNIDKFSFVLIKVQGF